MNQIHAMAYVVTGMLLFHSGLTFASLGGAGALLGASTIPAAILSMLIAMRIWRLDKSTSKLDVKRLRCYLKIMPFMMLIMLASLVVWGLVHQSVTLIGISVVLIVVYTLAAGASVRLHSPSSQ